MSKKKQIFKTTSIADIKNSATFGDRFMDKKSAYIFGYYEAAKKLTRDAIDAKCGNEKNILIYPICFNYRHYIELHLKSLVEEVEILCDKMQILGHSPCATVPAKVTGELDREHSLEVLLKWLKERLCCVSGEEFPQDIANYIKQMHDTDKNGQKYRYHKNKTGKLHFPKEATYDVANIAKIMQEVNEMLWAIDSYIDHHIDMADTIISDSKEI